MLLHVCRGDLVESYHNGIIVVVNSKGQVLSEIGDSQRIIFARSSMKLLQVIPALELGIKENFDLSEEAVSLFCASHSGEDPHTTTVEKLLNDAGLTCDDLKCGMHAPRHIPTYEKGLKNHIAFGPEHNNCSGKHTAMLLSALANSESLEDYYLLKHPVQQRILQTISELCEYPLEQIVLGIDGCGVPVHGLPLYNIALGYANLCANDKYNVKKTTAIETMKQSIIKAPEMIGGTDRFCTELIKVGNGELIAKAGAEGVYCIGHQSKKIGIAIKIDDGNSRASYPVAMEVLKQLELIDEQQYEHLLAFAKPRVLNVRGEIVGEIVPQFQLNAKRKEG